MYSTETNKAPSETDSTFDKSKFLSVKDLVVEYTSESGIVHAVNGVSFDLAEGETLGLVGETGAGKTTVALSIMRLIANPPGKIVGGEIRFEGQDLLGVSDRQMQRIRGEKIAMIFQDPMTSLNPLDTVGQQVAESLLLHKRISKKEAYEQACEMLEMVGIESSRYDEYPFQFSGGMRQRIVIAIALACMPKLLIADEPTTALDVTIQAQILELMNKLQRDLGTSVIMISHDLGIIAEMCKKVAIVYAGQIIEYGEARHIYKERQHPYTEGLFGSLPQLAKDGDHRRLSPIPGLMPDPTELPKGCKFAARCPLKTDDCTKERLGLTEVSKGHFVRCIRAKKN
jgi:peptide/nickel transport system ATP-binding protein